MAVNNGELHNIPVSSIINLNKFECKIDKEWKEYLHLNSPSYGGVLSNLYEKKRKFNDTFVTIDDKNRVWTLKSNGETSDLKIDGKTVNTLSNKTLKNTVKEDILYSDEDVTISRNDECLGGEFYYKDFEKAFADSYIYNNRKYIFIWYYNITSSYLEVDVLCGNEKTYLGIFDKSNEYNDYFLEFKDYLGHALFICALSYVNNSSSFAHYTRVFKADENGILSEMEHSVSNITLRYSDVEVYNGRLLKTNYVDIRPTFEDMIVFNDSLFYIYGLSSDFLHERNLFANIEDYLSFSVDYNSIILEGNYIIGSPLTTVKKPFFYYENTNKFSDSLGTGKYILFAVDYKSETDSYGYCLFEKESYYNFVINKGVFKLDCTDKLRPYLQFINNNSFKEVSSKENNIYLSNDKYRNDYGNIDINELSKYFNELLSTSSECVTTSWEFCIAKAINDSSLPSPFTNLRTLFTTTCKVPKIYEEDGTFKYLEEERTSYVQPRIINIVTDEKFAGNEGFMLCSSDNDIKIYYNNGYISGIGYKNSIYTRNVKRVLSILPNKVTYLDNDDIYNEIEIVTVEKLDFDIIGNFIKIDTSSDVNTVDITNETKWFNSSLDWNNRLNFLCSEDDIKYSFTIPKLQNSALETSMYLNVIFDYIVAEDGYVASAINEQFQRNFDNWSSTIYPAIAVKGNEDVLKSICEFSPFYNDRGNYYKHRINIYSNIVTPQGILYYTSLPGKDKELEGLVYPVESNVLYNIPIFLDVENSYYLNTFVKIGNNNYILLYNGTTLKPVLSYNLGTQTTLKGIFCIQGGNYGFTDEYIVPISYNSGTISQDTPICNIKGMKYISSTPYMAFFYSKMNRSIYTFTGDNTLKLMYEANRITDIKLAFYNTATQTIICLTNDGVIFIHIDGTMFRIEEVDYDEIIQGKDIISFVDYSGTIRDISLVKGLDVGYKKVPIELETEYFGAGDFTTSVNDCVYIRLSTDEDYEDLIGDVEVSSNCLTQISRYSESKKFHIEKNDWDKNTKTILLRYQPKYQEGIGFSIKVKSDFPISAIYINSTPITVTNSKNNI